MQNGQLSLSQDWLDGGLIMDLTDLPDVTTSLASIPLLIRAFFISLVWGSLMYGTLKMYLGLILGCVVTVVGIVAAWRHSRMEELRISGGYPELRKSFFIFSRCLGASLMSEQLLITHRASDFTMLVLVDMAQWLLKWR